MADSQYHSERSPYQQLPPGHIRVLCLEPGAKGSPLHATLKHVCLDDIPTIDARCIDFTRFQPWDIEWQNGGVAKTDESSTNQIRSSFRDKGLTHTLAVDSTVYRGCYAEYNYRLAQHDRDLLRDSALAYDAISYVWGEALFPQKIYIRGCSSIRITNSLYGALQRFRDLDRSRRLWADAVCINQNNLDEKGSQVEMMFRVYDLAANVLIWLGPAEAHDEMAYALIDRSSEIGRASSFKGADQSKFIDECLGSSQTCPCCPLASAPLTPDAPLTATVFLAVGKLLLRSWFSRLWVVQEVQHRLCSPKPVLVFSGSHVGLFDRLLELSDSMQLILPQEESYSVVRTASPAEIGRIWATTAQQVVFSPSHIIVAARTASWSAFSYLSHRGCVNPLDRVFAVRHLLGLQSARGLAADYNMSPLDLYARFAFITLAEESSPWLCLAIAHTTHACQGHCSWPSWVPDLTGWTRRSSGKIVRYQYHAFHGGAQFWPDPTKFRYRPVVGSQERVEVKGCIYAIIEEILVPEQTLSHANMEASRVTQLLEWYRACQAFARPLLVRCAVQGLTNPLKIQDAFHQLMTVGIALKQPYETTINCSDAENRLIRNEMRAIWQQDMTSANTLVDDESIEEIDRFASLLTDQGILVTTEPLSDRLKQVMCVTGGDSGMDIGWAPPGTRPGDLMCAIGGSPYPFVLRPQTDVYELVGDAFTIFTSLEQALGGANSSKPAPPLEISDIWPIAVRKYKKAYMSWDGCDGERTFDPTTKLARPPNVVAEMQSLVDSSLQWITLL